MAAVLKAPLYLSNTRWIGNQATSGGEGAWRRCCGKGDTWARPRDAHLNGVCPGEVRAGITGLGWGFA